MCSVKVNFAQFGIYNYSFRHLFNRIFFIIKMGLNGLPSNKTTASEILYCVYRLCHSRLSCLIEYLILSKIFLFPVKQIRSCTQDHLWKKTPRFRPVV